MCSQWERSPGHQECVLRWEMGDGGGSGRGGWKAGGSRLCLALCLSVTCRTCRFRECGNVVYSNVIKDEAGAHLWGVACSCAQLARAAGRLAGTQPALDSSPLRGVSVPV